MHMCALIPVTVDIVSHPALRACYSWSRYWTLPATNMVPDKITLWEEGLYDILDRFVSSIAPVTFSIKQDIIKSKINKKIFLNGDACFFLGNISRNMWKMNIR